jgi:hypothetical protein
MSMSPATTLDSLIYYLTSGAVNPRPIAWTLSIHTGSPGNDASANEAAYAGYARQALAIAVDSGDPAAPKASNTELLTFPASDSNYTISHVVVRGGTAVLAIQALPSSKLILAGEQAVLAPGELTIGGRN